MRSPQERLEAATAAYYSSVGSIATYLTDRGITGEAAQKFRLGFVDQPQPGHEQFTGRLAIPYLLASGSVAWMKFRATDDSEPKYLGLPGGRTRLYNVAATLATGDVIAVCEGELDAIILQELCGIPAVGVPGVTNWKPHFRRVLADFPTILAIGDGDEPGREFSKLLAREIGAQIVDMPAGHDVTSLVLSAGPNELRRRAGL